jgi:glucose-6-phosphate 1-dehydrogenase
MAEFVPVPSFDLVVFGASGDLALRKLFPSLYHRYKDGQIPPDSRIVGVARQAMTHEAFLTAVSDGFSGLAGGDASAQTFKDFLKCHLMRPKLKVIGRL